eukprot:TRINITY_DN3308_c0_g1_i1.p1 TRINITY_DN3308_c0_g1~~TRINITY_DN3308_c0_g1_i1.p1  ORF type:complete len:467 (+),score=84.06 TRINITY_DN3308_c0_g1_i1:144-1544(+)
MALKLCIRTNLNKSTNIEVAPSTTLKQLIESIAKQIDSSVDELSKCALVAVGFQQLPTLIDLSSSLSSSLSLLHIEDTFTLVFTYPFRYLRKTEDSKQSDDEKGKKTAKKDRDESDATMKMFKGLTLKNCFSKMAQVKESDTKEMRRIATFMGNHSDSITTNSKLRAALLSLPEKSFAAFLSSDFQALLEIDLFQLMIEWGQHQLTKAESESKTLDSTELPKKLKETIKDLIPCIRFPLMDASALANKVVSSGVLEQDVILDLFAYSASSSSSEKTILSSLSTPKSLAKFSFKPRTLAMPFSWDPRVCRSGLQLSNNNRRVMKIETGSDWRSVRGLPEIKNGKCTYSIKVIELPSVSNTWKINVGFGTFSFAATSVLGGSSDFGYAFIAGGMKSHDSSSGTNYGAQWTTGDVVTCVLDNSNISFYVNGKSQGVAFDNVDPKTPYFPALSVCGQGTIVEFCSTPKLA